MKISDSVTGICWRSTVSLVHDATFLSRERQGEREREPEREGGRGSAKKVQGRRELKRGEKEGEQPKE